MFLLFSFFGQTKLIDTDFSDPQESTGKTAAEINILIPGLKPYVTEIQGIPPTLQVHAH